MQMYYWSTSVNIVYTEKPDRLGFSSLRLDEKVLAHAELPLFPVRLLKNVEK